MTTRTSIESLTLEHHFSDKWFSDVEIFWQSGQFSHFYGVDNIRVNYASFTQDKENPCIVISPGRYEGYLKYKELAFDLVNQGYQLFIIDHRGQGLSQRMLDNPHKGYVKRFDDYVDDLNQFINQIVAPNSNNRKPFLLAHSMGAAIAARLLQKYPSCVEATVLSSPMIAINSGLMPSWLAKGLVNITYFINKLFTKNHWYFIGQKDYKASRFDGNNLSQSLGRYQNLVTLYQNVPEIQLGGVTIHWLKQAIKNQLILFAELDKISSPVFIIQAGSDTIVDNEMQSEFCSQLNQINSELFPAQVPLIIEGARHELFFEQDKYRIAALSAAVNWFEKYQ